MRRLIRFATALVALAFVFYLGSCEKQKVADEKSEVSFEMNNLSNSLSKKGVGDQGTLPTCEDKDPAYVVITISGVDYTLNVLQNLEDGNQTEVIKLDAGDYTIDNFVVYAADDDLIWAAPMEGSYYEDLWDLDGVSKDFKTLKFQKKKVSIDVLCYQPFNYDKFGFNWFEFSRIEIKTLCFFGDVCVEDYEFWHSEGSYYGQSNQDGYDFPAIFEVVIEDSEGNQINDPALDDNIYYPDGSPWQGVGEPLCVEYPDIIGQTDEYTLKIFLILPNGDKLQIREHDFLAETDPIEVAQLDGNTEMMDDGVYDFAVGELCGGIKIFKTPPPPPPEDEVPEGCETAFAFFENPIDPDATEIGYVFNKNPLKKNPYLHPALNIGTRWGWAGNLTESGTYDIYAAAGGNDLSKGTKVGTLEVDISGSTVKVTYTMDPGYSTDELHIYASDAEPTDPAPGQYGNTVENFADDTTYEKSFNIDDAEGDGIWIIAHAVVCGFEED